MITVGVDPESGKEIKFVDPPSIEITMGTGKIIRISFPPGGEIAEIYTPDKGLVIYPQDFRTIYIAVEK